MNVGPEAASDESNFRITKNQLGLWNVGVTHVLFLRSDISDGCTMFGGKTTEELWKDILYSEVSNERRKTGYKQLRFQDLIWFVHGLFNAEI